ncbi:MarR family transcriptional regulator [Phyllobacterium salinisoli]|uniref:MarR family transcriptional regulator n=1 Tax=Phyllobacterium salinisoli TaxID=1899321 RepID=A0A368K0T7_9HYPH|nr:MarR family transcriptional regulator [Phyllobacterium salinisoli]RCS22841.1 MarR family transcriptional regulator [Phyllobacterium salinisoli]
MTRALDARWQDQRFSATALQEVFDNPLEGETPQSRLKQIGMMTLLYMMHQKGEKLTLANIKEMTGLTRNTVKESIDPLVARGILQESIVKNSVGRGTAWQYEFNPQIVERLQSGASTSQRASET